MPKLDGDLFSHALPLDGAVFLAVFVVAVDETILNVMNNLIRRRAIPCSNYNDQHPLAKRPKCTTRVSVKDQTPSLSETEQRKTKTKD